MPLGNDPTPLAELEAGFGVTSSAEQLIAANRANVTREQLSSELKPVNDELTAHLRENQDKLEEHLGHEVVDCAVRGSGTKAFIHYVYVGPRNANESDVVPFADVLGSAALKRQRKQEVARDADPDEAAREAEGKVAADAAAEARRILDDARAQAEELLRDTQEKAQAVLAEAKAKAAEAQAKAAEDAPNEAEKARAAAEKAKADAEAAEKGESKTTGKSGKGK